MMLLVCLLASQTTMAQRTIKGWTVASESADYSVSQKGDTIEVRAPKGLTLWYDKMLTAPSVIEYDACVVDEGKPGDRVSDLNCFWMASLGGKDSNGKIGDPRRVSGKFVDCYAMQLYYMGYGGNGNTTTRFRRYDGDKRGVTDAKYRPAILTEYTDPNHLNVANKWRHIRISADATGCVTYEIDGEKLVNYVDPKPLNKGWFGLRTTESRIRIANFKVSNADTRDGAAMKSANDIVLHNVNGRESATLSRPMNFGVPFSVGKVTASSRFTLNGQAVEMRPLAYWPDGSIKWAGFTALSTGAEKYVLTEDKAVKNAKAPKKSVNSDASGQDKPQLAYNANGSEYWCDSLVWRGRTVLRNGACQYWVTGEKEPRNIRFSSIKVERESGMQTVLLAHSELVDLRIYLTNGSPEIRLVHTYINRRKDTDPMLKSINIVAEVPLHESLYNRHVAFSTDTDKPWHEPVQLLDGRRRLQDELYPKQLRGERIPEVETLTEKSQSLISHWATWDGYRLSQLSDEGYTIRKRAKSDVITESLTPGPEGIKGTPWIGLFSGRRNPGAVFLGEVSGGIVASLQDFWQSYPSSIYVEGMTKDVAQLKIELWSEEGEAMDMRHYDTEAHDLEASYEDVQKDMSTAFGMARTSEVSIIPVDGWIGDEAFSQLSKDLQHRCQLVCTPEYLHQQRAFGVWSLPTRYASVENEIKHWADFMVGEQQKRHWYGFWNYGDVIHGYDQDRQEWRYDIGGYGWDNTELASNMFLWYNFLRTGRKDLWDMAVAMTRHTSEVDVYHDGPWSGLGSRHNVTHWGCGAKESRISEAQWNRFYYYMSGGDERLGELMHAVIDLDTLLYTLDPMRLAQPRDAKTPCTAPARLRIGPDWLGYVSNWMTEWERTHDNKYLKKILTGMESINNLPLGMFTGPMALGYDPATGIISWEGDTAVTNTNHLCTLMGGFEMLTELMPTNVEDTPGLTAEQRKAFVNFRNTWLTYCDEYRTRAGLKGFPIPRLAAYAAWQNRDMEKRNAAWLELERERPRPNRFATNEISTWSLGAIFMLETIPMDVKIKN